MNHTASRPELLRTKSFRKEVYFTLKGEGLSPEASALTIKRWGKYVYARWKAGHPSEDVGHALARFEKEGIVCPCGKATCDGKRKFRYDSIQKAGNQ